MHTGRQDQHTLEARLLVAAEETRSTSERKATPTRFSSKLERGRPMARALAVGLLVATSVLFAALDKSPKSVDGDSREARKDTFALWVPVAQASAQMPILSSVYSQYLSSDAPSSLTPRAGAPTSQTSHQEKRDLSSSISSSSSGSSGEHRSNEPVCQVKDGESVAIVEIEESRGSDTSQWTNPSVLPISGSVELAEIELKIESETHKYFKIENKSLRLTRPLDRDSAPVQTRENSTQPSGQQISSIYLQLSCTDKRPLEPTSDGSSNLKRRQRKVIIPVLVKVLDLNDNAPKFSKPIYTIHVDELTPVGSIVFDQLQATDLDSASNGQIEYTLLGPGSQSTTTLAQASSDFPMTTVRSQRLLQRVAPTTVAPLASTSEQRNDSALAPKLALTSTTVRAYESTRAPSASQQVITTEASEEFAGKRNKSEPTISLNSEPIVNGPMEVDENEDDEEGEQSDDELLAITDANRHGQQQTSSTSFSVSTSGQRGNEGSTTIAPSGQEEHHSAAVTSSLAPSGGGERRRRRRRRRSHLTTLGVTTTKGPPWTNLLVHQTTGGGGGQDLTAASDSLGNSLQDEQFDSGEFFSLELSPLTRQPVLKLRKALDYETRRVHTLKVMATDRAKGERLSSVATVLVRVLDGDDQAPVFVLDQQGCATSSIAQTTTPTSFGAAQMQTNRPPVSGAGDHNNDDDDPPPATSNSDEHLSEFWDTLGLDDNPIESGRPSAGAKPNERQQAREGKRGQKTPNARFDYQCLASMVPSSGGGGAEQKQAQAEYFATVMSGDSDYVLRVAPQAVRARDRDELNAPIRYSFINGTPANYSNYFQINPLDASIKQVAPAERSQVAEFQLWIQAQEVSQLRLASVARLTISVLASDKSPPELVPNSYAGQIEENSPIGARVLVAGAQQASQNYLRISVLGSEASSKLEAEDLRAPKQQVGGDQSRQNHQRPTSNYQFETTSDSFGVDSDGFVYVTRQALDRDEPHQAVHMFQVTARQVGLASSRSLSSPISLNVSLIDKNDNPPQLVNATLTPVRMAANSRGGSQQLTQIRYTDRDAPGANSRAHFALRHVSNSGADKFRIDQETGQIEAVGKFYAGEQFSLLVQVTDELQRQAQGILEVLVVPGANIGGPQFVIDGNERDNSLGYSIEVNEATPVRSAVLQVRAVDPENDQISYSLVATSDNQAALSDFSINSKTGVISVASQLDREEISAYSLLVQARDSGGLATTRPIQISVTDSNDNNPIFERPNYEFDVNENETGLLVGRVQASDSDAADNGRITYSLQELGGLQSANSETKRELFDIDAQTGEIRLINEALDYEKKRTHTLMVSARDNGQTPRQSSVSVQVHVLDVNDELPYFERAHYETELDENLAAGQRVAQVEARDSDSVAQISYILLAGDSSLFAVHPTTGLVSSLKALDYEQAREHTILIGTNESLLVTGFDLVRASNRLNEAIAQQQQLNRSPIVRVDVHVRDLNDEAPQFEWASQAALLPVRVQDTALLGSPVVQLSARDRDASSPNNQVRFELVRRAAQTNSSSILLNATLEQQQQQDHTEQITSENCANLFMVDPTLGLVSVASDLKRALQVSECRLVVRAYDLPLDERARLSSYATLIIFIDHLAELSPLTSIGFADSLFTVELEENAPANTLVKVIPVINKPKSGANYPLSCELVATGANVNAELTNKFYVKANEQFDCELRTRNSELDYEERQRYALTVKLNTIGGTSRSLVTQIQVNVIDQNDNRPVFAPIARYGHLTQQRHLAVVALDSPSETQVIQLRATDADLSQPNNLISYELLSAEQAVISAREMPATSQQADEPEARDAMGERFKIDPVDGIVRTARSIDDLPASRLPLRLRVLARDNPHEASATLESMTEVVVNLIDNKHRIVLALRDTPSNRVLASREQLLAILQERTGLIAGLERIESLKVQRNSSLIETDTSGTDVWLYLIEPGSLRILASDDARVRATLFDARAQSSLADVIGQSLAFSKLKVRQPFALGGAGEQFRGVREGAVSVLESLMSGGQTANDRLAPVLILIALIIAILSAIVVIYQCGSLASLSAASGSMLPVAKQLVGGPIQGQPSNKLDQMLLAGLYQQQQQPTSLTPSLSQFGVSAEKMAAEQQAQLRFSDGSALQPLGQCTDPYGSQQQQQQRHCTSYATSYNGAPLSSAAASKEYETQMLKMSVLFDDNQSFDGQNLQEKTIVSQNLMA